MSILANLRERVGTTFGLFQSEEPARIGIYGPPNSGKSTLANRICRDWTGNELGSEGPMPHETRRAKSQKDITIEQNGKSVTIDIVDTPGVTTSVDKEEFIDYNMDDESAEIRAREATEGIAEAMHWLREDVDGVLYMMDSTDDPYTQVNTMVTGIIESQGLPALVLANKTDLDDSDAESIKDAYPQHEMVPISAKDGDNMDDLYEQIAEQFG